jgi:hypothetical protein
VANTEDGFIKLNARIATASGWLQRLVRRSFIRRWYGVRSVYHWRSTMNVALVTDCMCFSFRRADIRAGANELKHSRAWQDRDCQTL